MNLIQRFPLLLLSFFIILVAAVPVFGQDNGEEDSDGLLPDIESQNIEIRGEFKAQFPGLERQPILGFDPGLRIYQFPADRMPYMEMGEDAVARLTLSQFSRPAGPDYTPLLYPDVHYLFARAGYGSFQSPMVQFWGTLPIDESSYLGLDIDYASSSEGHMANRPSAYRYFTGNVEFGTQLNEYMDLYVYAGMQNDFNYAARFNQPSGEIARIEFEGIHAGVALSRFKNEVTGWKLQGDLRSFTNSYKRSNNNGKIDEMVFSGSFAYRWALGHPGETLTATVSGRGGLYEPNNTGEQNWSTYYGGLAYERLFNYSTRLYAEGKLYYISNFV